MAETRPADLLAAWIGRQAAPDAMSWLADKRTSLAADTSGRALCLAISMASRRIGKADLTLSDDDLAAADRARPGWRPVGWSLDQTARVLLLLTAAQNPEPPFVDRLRALIATSDVGELIAIYRGLPLYPDQASLAFLATDGLRTAMRAVFEAVAHHNPFPAEQFSQSAWNHMVLKTLFIDSTLGPIEGLDRRWNAELAGILRDYAHERWAAGRPVTPELWRGVGRFADDAAVDDLVGVLRTGSPLERRAAALALAESGLPTAAARLAESPDLADAVRGGHITWESLVPRAEA